MNKRSVTIDNVTAYEYSAIKHPDSDYDIYRIVPQNEELKKLMPNGFILELSHKGAIYFRNGMPFAEHSEANEVSQNIISDLVEYMYPEGASMC